MPRRLEKGRPPAAKEEQTPTPPRAGDAARQIGTGFFKMADVIDECPPLAKLFEGGFLERRFQEVFKLPGVAMGSMIMGGPNSNSTDGSNLTDDTGGSSSSSSGATGAISTAVRATENRGRPHTERCERGEEGGGGRSERSSSQEDVLSPSPSRRGAGKGAGSGGRSSSVERRRGTRGSRSTGEADAWPGLEQALKESEKEMPGAATPKVLGTRGRPEKEKSKDDFAKRRRKPSPPVPLAFAFPPAPPPRRAAAAALHRMSSLSSSSTSSAVTSAATKTTAPTTATAAVDKNKDEDKDKKKCLPAAASAVVVRGGKAGSGGAAKRSKKEAVPEGGDVPVKGKDGAAADVDVLVSKADGGGGGGGGGGDGTCGKKKSVVVGVGELQQPIGRGDAAGGGDLALKGGKKNKKKNTAAAVEAMAIGGGVGKPSASKRRKSDAEMLEGLDFRVFRHVEAGQCGEEGCEVRGEAHCHRGPGCDCTRNRETYLWPSEMQSMMRHQERHREWNTKPAFGKRVMVEFEEGNYYPGTINTDGTTAKDRKHARGRWGVLFDDCTRDRFHDDADDVMVSIQPRPTTVSEELRDYYLRQENGEKLLAGVKVVAAVESGRVDVPSNHEEKSNPGIASSPSSANQHAQHAKKNVVSGKKTPTKVSKAKAARDALAKGRGSGSSKPASGSSGGCGEDVGVDEDARSKKRKHTPKEKVSNVGTGVPAGGKGASKSSGAKKSRKKGSVPTATRDGERENVPDDGARDAAAGVAAGDDDDAGVGRAGTKARRTEHEETGRAGGAKKKKKDKACMAGEGERGGSTLGGKSKTGGGLMKGAALAPRDAKKQHPRKKKAKGDEAGERIVRRKLLKGGGGDGVGVGSTKKEKKTKEASSGTGSDREQQGAGGRSANNNTQASSEEQEQEQFVDDATSESNSRGHRQHSSDADTIVSSGFSPGWVEPSGREATGQTRVRSNREISPHGKKRPSSTASVEETTAAAPPAVADLRTAVVSERGRRQDGGMGGKGPAEDMVAASGWVSLPRVSDSSSNDNNAGKVSTPARLTMSEEEEGGGDEREEESTVIKGVAKHGAGTAVCNEVDRGGGRGGRGGIGAGGSGGVTTANVVPVLSGPSVSTADPHTLAAAHVLISGLGV